MAMLEPLISIFSNRELATGFWLLVIFGFSLSQHNIRTSAGGVVRAVLQIKVVVLFSSLAGWLSLGTLALWRIGWWTPEQLKLSIFWYLFSGVVLLARAIQNQSDASFFRRVITSQFAVVALIEFIVVFYSFELWIEIMFLPFITIVFAMKAISEKKQEKEKYDSVRKLLDGIIILVLAISIMNFFSRSIGNYGTIFDITTLRKVTIPILYTLWALPVFYLWWCVARWEKERCRLNRKTYHTEDLRSYAKNAFFRSLFLRPVLLKRAVRQFNSLPAKSQQDVENIIGQVHSYEAGRRQANAVNISEGWSPYAAEKFLLAEGYETNDFHDTGFDGEWFAESQPTYLKNAGPFDTLIYRINGREGLVRKLQIKGSFKTGSSQYAGLAQMKGLCLSLIQAGTDNEDMPGQVVDGFESLRHAHVVVANHRFVLTFNWYREAEILDVEFVCTPLGN